MVGGMGGMMGLTILVCVAAIGLVHLALGRSSVEHRVGSVVIGAIGLALLFSAPFAGVLLVSLAMWSRRFVGAMAGLRMPARLPDRVPSDWA